jgi:hypothetical protein
LSFWYRGDLGYGDYARVEASKDGGVTWASIWSATNQVLSTWNLISLDLTSYRTSSFKVRFRITSNGDTEKDGWYVDDISISEADVAPKSIPFVDDFEQGIGNWTVSGYDWNVTDTQSRSTSHSLTDSPGANYVANADTATTLTKPLDLSNSTKPVLSFWYRGDLGYGDYARVDVSKDGGVTWASIWSATNQVLSTWSLISLDLTSYKTSSFKVRFRITSNGDTEKDGWYIDDVEIKEQ